MAQIKQVFTCCDVCNPECVASGGFFDGNRKEAQKIAGYIRRKGKDICSECQDDEEENAERVRSK